MGVSLLVPNNCCLQGHSPAPCLFGWAYHYKSSPLQRSCTQSRFGFLFPPHSITFSIPLYQYIKEQNYLSCSLSCSVIFYFYFFFFYIRALRRFSFSLFPLLVRYAVQPSTLAMLVYLRCRCFVALGS